MARKKAEDQNVATEVVAEELKDEKVDVTEAVKQAQEKADDQFFDRRSIESASKKERREMYSDSRVITRTGDDPEAETVEKKRLEEFHTLADAAKKNFKLQVPLMGTIVGVDPKHEVLDCPCAMLLLDNSDGYFQIVVPANFLFKGAPDLTPEQKVTEITFRIGAHVPFVPFRIIEARQMVVASVLHAMEIDAGRIYKKKQRDNHPLLEPGVEKKDIAEAEIVKVTTDSIIVQVSGAEGEIRRDEISYNRMLSPSEKYKVGDRVLVKVLGITEENAKINDFDIRIYSVKASVKQAQPRPDELFFDSYKEGCMYNGVVKLENEHGKFFVTLNNQIDCLCRGSLKGKPKPGDKVIVRVTQKKQFDGVNQLWGDIFKIFNTQ